MVEINILLSVSHKYEYKVKKTLKQSDAGVIGE